MQLGQLLAGLAAAGLPLAAAETVLGAYILHRHGDRTAKAWPPVNLTALGAEQVYDAGAFYRARYVAAAAPQKVRGLAADVAVLSQLSVTSPVDTVLQNSAQVFLQALYPPAGDAAAETLANGTSVRSPLGGYQYVPVNAVTSAATSQNAENNEWLQGGSGCGRAVLSSNSYFASQQYADTYKASAAFYQGLLPVVNGTFNTNTSTFKNGYSVFDLINCATVHNASIQSASLLTPDALLRLRTLADEHEWGLAYNSTDTIRAIAGAVLAGQVLQALNATVLGRAAPRATIQFGAYATFMSFFGLAQLPAASPDFMGIVTYASSVVFELVTNATAVPVRPDDISVRFLFSNGTASAASLREFPLFGQPATTLTWPVFSAEMAKFAIHDTAHWCQACGNTTGVCAVDAGPSSTPGPEDGGNGSSHLSLPVAGVIGALVTLVVILGIEALVIWLGRFRLVKRTPSVASGGSAGGVKA